MKIDTNDSKLTSQMQAEMSDGEKYDGRKGNAGPSPFLNLFNKTFSKKQVTWRNTI